MRNPSEPCLYQQPSLLSLNRGYTVSNASVEHSLQDIFAAFQPIVAGRLRLLAQPSEEP
jgi:hypothetical protein